MYIETIKNRNSLPAVLLRESYREGGKVCKRTLKNLSGLPEYLIEGMKELLKGKVPMANLKESFTITETRPHGHVAATLGVLKQTGLDKIIHTHTIREGTKLAPSRNGWVME